MRETEIILTDLTDRIWGILLSTCWRAEKAEWVSADHRQTLPEAAAIPLWKEGVGIIRADLLPCDKSPPISEASPSQGWLPRTPSCCPLMEGQLGHLVDLACFSFILTRWHPQSKQTSAQEDSACSFASVPQAKQFPGLIQGACGGDNGGY